MFVTVVNAISKYAIIVVIGLIVAYGAYKKINLYESFTEGAKGGFTTAVTIIPYLVAMLVAIGVLRASGAMDLAINAISPITSKIGIPAETLPMAFIRPLSGGGAQGVMVDIFETYGADSLISRTAAVMMGSTETTFYVLAVYFGAVQVTEQRHAIASGLTADLAGLLMAVFMARIFFG